MSGPANPFEGMAPYTSSPLTLAEVLGDEELEYETRCYRPDKVPGAAVDEGVVLENIPVWTQNDYLVLTQGGFARDLANLSQPRRGGSGDVYNCLNQGFPQQKDFNRQCILGTQADLNHWWVNQGYQNFTCLGIRHQAIGDEAHLFAYRPSQDDSLIEDRGAVDLTGFNQVVLSVPLTQDEAYVIGVWAQRSGIQTGFKAIPTPNPQGGYNYVIGFLDKNGDEKRVLQNLEQLKSAIRFQNQYPEEPNPHNPQNWPLHISEDKVDVIIDDIEGMHDLTFDEISQHLSFLGLG